MSFSMLIAEIKQNGVNYCRSYMADVLDENDRCSYNRIFDNLKETFNEFLPNMDFNKIKAFARTYYEFDPEHFLGRNIEIFYVVLGLARLAYENGVQYKGAFREILSTFFNEKLINELREVLPENDRDTFLLDYNSLKVNFK